MVKRNQQFAQLSPNYLFPEVVKRASSYPNAISLSIGDTSEPLGETIVHALKEKAHQLGTSKGYQGYGPEAGDPNLRKAIAKVYYHELISPDEVFISDGAKCDIGRVQLMFGPQVKIAVQDPTYPVYVDTGTLVGNRSISYLPCLPENDFFPSTFPNADVIYLCSPNNPTGAALTHQQLRFLVNWAKKNQSLIVFDTAYAGFIQDPTLPRTIYEIEGATEVAIEVSSLSKLVGFTGIRLGWTVIPKNIKYEDGHPLHADFSRLMTTFFNGASHLSQAGALAALSPKGIEEMKKTLSFYLENATLIRNALHPKGFPIYGGENAPYLWVDFGKRKSWDLFQTLLETTGIITTPGSGFGASGEGFLRFSAFGSRKHILNAIERIEKKWPENLLSMSPLPT